MILTQRVPNFVDSRPKKARGSLARILRARWVRRWSREGLDGVPFRRWSRSDDLLVAEYGEREFDGETYPVRRTVVGRVEDPDAEFMALPEAGRPPGAPGGAS